MSERIQEKKWKKSLTSIVEELSDTEYRKMLQCLDKIPKCNRDQSKEEMPQVIIQVYGLQKSIAEIKKAMENIPRMDSDVQDLLRPFVDKGKTKQQKEKEKQKRKLEPDSESDVDEPAADQKSAKCSKFQSKKEKTCPPWREPIANLKASGRPSKPIAGKVVVKSGLRPYQTKKKEKKALFFLGLADETSSIKVTVYGKERYGQMKEGSYYMFRDILMDDDIIKVTKLSTITMTTAIEVSADLEEEARMLVDYQSPVCSIKDAKMSAEKTMMSVEGSITKMDSVVDIKVKDKRRRTKQQVISLSNGTESIRVCLWGEVTDQARGLSVGDFVRVSNVKTNVYRGTVSLNATIASKINKMQNAAVQTGTVDLIGLKEAGRQETHLEAFFNQNVQSFVVESSLLAEAFDIKLEGDFQVRLLSKMPLSGNAEIRGNKIIKITAT